MRFLKALIRSIGWFVAWLFLLLALVMTAYPLRRDSSVARENLVFTMSWGMAALLLMTLLWRWKAPRAWSLMASILFLGVSSGVFLVFSQPPPRIPAIDGAPAPTFHVPSQRRSVSPTPAAPPRHV